MRDMKKERVKNIIKVIVFMLIFCGFMALGSVMLYPKTSDPEGGLSNPNARGFYGEPKNSIDLVVMGNSNAYSAYSPMLMWKKYGIPSYVVAEGAQNIAETVNILEELLTCQKPKLIVLDVDLLWQGKTQVSRVEGNVKSLIYKYIPIMKYHDRWKGFALGDSFKAKNYTYRSSSRGQYLSKTVVPYTGEDMMVKTADVESVPKSSRFFLKMFLDLCEENDIDVMFVEMPTANSWNYKKHNGMTKYAKELGIPFVDLNTTEGKNAINWKKDTRDGGRHLNCYGAKKVTREIGKYISENYTFTNKKKDPEYKSWNKSYKEYKQFMKTDKKSSDKKHKKSKKADSKQSDTSDAKKQKTEKTTTENKSETTTENTATEEVTESTATEANTTQQ